MGKTTTGGTTAKATMRVTKALAELQRLRILMMLQTGEMCVCQVVEVLGLASSTVSKHLSILDAAGLVESRKEGRWMYYRLPEGAAGELMRPLLTWLSRRTRDDATIAADRERLQRVLASDPQLLCRRQRRSDSTRAGRTG
jgi:ArsR family transcriptional regulator, arsenate/arsenite/antimonite-responsive transcriptional repressor